MEAAGTHERLSGWMDGWKEGKERCPRRDCSISLLLIGGDRLCGEHAIDLDERVEDESERNDDPDEVGSVSKPKVKQMIKSELLWARLRVVAVSESGDLRKGDRRRENKQGCDRWGCS